jgi:hypothetical protein
VNSERSMVNRFLSEGVRKECEKVTVTKPVSCEGNGYGLKPSDLTQLRNETVEKVLIAVIASSRRERGDLNRDPSLRSGRPKNRVGLPRASPRNDVPGQIASAEFILRLCRWTCDDARMCHHCY